MSAWKPRITPRSRSARTRARQVDGATPTRSASSLLEIRASAARCRQDRAVGRVEPGRTSFGRPAAGRGRSRVAVGMMGNLANVLRSVAVAHPDSSPLRACESASPARSRTTSTGSPSPRPARTSSAAPGTRCSSSAAPGWAARSPTPTSWPPAPRIARRPPTRSGPPADLLLKVKEPIEQEYHRLRRGPGAVHLPAPGRRHGRAPRRCWTPAPPPSPTRPCSWPTGSLPLLAPMSEVAGRLAPQVGAYHLMRPRAAAACCSAACPGCARPRSSSSAAASPAQNAVDDRRRAWAPTSPCSTST